MQKPNYSLNEADWKAVAYLMYGSNKKQKRYTQLLYGFVFFGDVIWRLS